MNYTEYVATIANLTVITATDPNFVQILPQAIASAEQRIYRDLDLLSTVNTAFGALTAGNRNFTLPQFSGRFVVTNGINVVIPNASNGLRFQMTPVSRDFLDAAWGSVAGSAMPKLYAPITDQTFIVGPWPDQDYVIEIFGTIRPTPLSATQTETNLTLFLPDLFIAASMIFMAGYQKDFGSQSDDPASAVSWQGQYDKLLASANVEEFRKKYSSSAWSSLSPTPLATPNR